MSNKTLVPDKLHGYLLQVIHMLYELISVDDRVVSIEKLDDVAVEIDGKVIAEQLKSVTSANNPIADRAAVFWKTLYNWCTYIEGGSLPPDAILRFVVVSNSTVTPGSIQKTFMNAHTDDEAQRALTYAKDTILHASTENPDVDIYATLPDSYRDYIRYLFDDTRSQIVCNIIKSLEIEIHNDRVESQSLAIQREESYTLESISRFLGRIDAAISTYERIGTDSELQAKLDEVNTRIVQLKKEVNESEIRRKLDYALNFLKTEMGKILAKLDVEHPEDPVEFVIKDLTVRVKSQTGRDDYLWEIGSASNWLSYHIALILALQRFFQTKSSVNVPNFIIFDQPSQVYFPRTRHFADEDKPQLNDDDKNAVRKIFECLFSPCSCSYRLDILANRASSILPDTLSS